MIDDSLCSDPMRPARQNSRTFELQARHSVASTVGNLQSLLFTVGLRKLGNEALHGPV